MKRPANLTSPRREGQRRAPAAVRAEGGCTVVGVQMAFERAELRGRAALNAVGLAAGLVILPAESA
jgi:hypothetical protein